jgi:hypothetical protein
VIVAVAKLSYTNGTSGYATNIGEKREISIVIDKFREKVTRGVEYMEDIDNAVSKFEYEVDIMEEKFRQMKHNCF